MKSIFRKILKASIAASPLMISLFGLTSCVDRADYAPNINKNTVFEVGRNQLHFELGQEVNTLDVLTKAELSYQNDGEDAIILTKDDLTSRYCTYDLFDTSAIGNYILNINYSSFNMEIDYSVDQYQVDFYLDENTPYLEGIKPLIALGDDLSLACVINPNLDYNYAIDPNTIENDEAKGLAFAGWTLDGNSIVGDYYIDCPIGTNIKNVRFMASFLSDDELDCYDIVYDDQGRKCFNGYLGNPTSNVYIPESVTYIDLSLALTATNFENLYIPSTASISAVSSPINSKGVKTINVNNNNPYNSSYDGVLYNKNLTKLILAPSNINENFNFASTINIIGDYAFTYSQLKEINNLPSYLISIGDYAFAYSDLEKVGTISVTVMLGNNVFYESKVTEYFESDEVAQYYVNYDSDGSKLYTLVAVVDKDIIEYTVWDRTVAISLNAFDNCAKLTSITFNTDGMLESIGGGAFNECTSLVSVAIPDSVKYLGPSLFFNCTSLTSAAIPDVAYQSTTNITPHTLPSYTFYGCSSLTTASIAEGIEAIEVYAFYKCTSLTAISLPSSLKEIGGYVFSNCNKLANIDFNSKITSLGVYAFMNIAATEFDLSVLNITTLPRYAFYSCYSLKSIVIPDYVTVIDKYCFTNCKSLTSITFGSNVENIGERAFYTGYTNTMPATLELPSSLKTIDTYAFGNWQKLTSLIIPDNVTYIGNYSFRGCTRLTSVYFGARVQTIGEYPYLEEEPLTFGGVGPTFYGCSSLETFEVSPSNQNLGVYYGVLYNKNFEEAIWSPAKNSVANGEVILHSNAKVIYPYAFFSQTTVTSIILNEGLENIGKAAFYNSTAISSLTIPSSVVNIGAGICNGMTGLTDFTIAAGNNNYYSDGKFLYSADKKTLKGYVSALSGSITIPDGVEVIDYGALQSCTAITEIILPDSVKAIGERAFASDSKLESLVIGSGLSEIANDAFKDCIAITSIEIAENNPNMKVMNSILYSADEKILYLSPTNNPMTELSISKNVEEIRGYAFAYNNNLIKVVLPENVKSINAYAFYECQNISYLELDDACTSIGDYAFSFTLDSANDGLTDKLSTVVLGKGIMSIGINAFCYNTNISAVYYKATYSDVVNFKNKNKGIAGSSYLFKGYKVSAVQYIYSATSDYLVTPAYFYWHYVDGQITNW